MTRNKVIFFLNGEKQEVSGAFAPMMLVDYLRRQKHLSGTKVVCSEGDCGACTVLKFTPHSQKAKIQSGHKSSDQNIRAYRNLFLPINSCITPVASLDGSHLVTIEALAQSTSELSLVQQKMVEHHGSQCGFCTPGFVMALTGLAEKRQQRNDLSPLKEKEVKNALTGNLCRCTGYEPILTAGKSLPLNKYQSLKDRFCTKATQAQLQKECKVSLEIKTDTSVFYAPTNLKELKSIFKREKRIRVLGAGTDLGVVHNKGRIRLSHVLSLHRIQELYEISAPLKDVIKVGARVTLSELREISKTRCPELARYLDVFASPQIKNVATLVGNLVNASPIGDTLPFLLATDAQIEIQGPVKTRTVSIADFFISYRKTALKPQEIVTYVSFQIPEKLKLYKVSARKDLDISAVTLAYSILKMKKAFATRIALGGVAATPIRLHALEKYLSENSNFTIRGCLKILESQLKPLSDARGSAAFRKLLVKNLLIKALTDLQAPDPASALEAPL